MDPVTKAEKIKIWNPRGSLKEIHSSLIPDLLKQGWKLPKEIPKRNYAPELDIENENGVIPSLTEEDIDQANILRFEDI